MKTIFSAILMSLCFIPTSQAAMNSAQQAEAAAVFPLWLAMLITGVLLISIVGIVFSVRRRRRVRVKATTPPPARRRRRRRAGRRRRTVIVVK